VGVRRTRRDDVKTFARRPEVIALLFLITILGCAKKSLSPSEPSPRAGDGRTVIRSGSLELRARELTVVKSEVERIVQENQGWLESWSLTDNRFLNMTVRVPEPALDDVMNALSSLGKVVSRSLRSVDVTEEMIDLESRLGNLKALRDRLRAYLERASDLKEILEVERELVRVQTEIESIEGKLKALRSRVAMSELKLSVKKRRL